jgi:hypothetical protein
MASVVGAASVVVAGASVVVVGAGVGSGAFGAVVSATLDSVGSAGVASIGCVSFSASIADSQWLRKSRHLEE